MITILFSDPEDTYQFCFQEDVSCSYLVIHVLIYSLCIRLQRKGKVVALLNRKEIRSFN